MGGQYQRVNWFGFWIWSIKMGHGRQVRMEGVALTIQGLWDRQTDATFTSLKPIYYTKTWMQTYCYFNEKMPK